MAADWQTVSKRPYIPEERERQKEKGKQTEFVCASAFVCAAYVCAGSVYFGLIALPVWLFSFIHLFVYVLCLCCLSFYGWIGIRYQWCSQGSRQHWGEKLLVASGNDCVPSCQTFTLADEQNIKFDREWVFSPHDPKILHVHSHTMNVFLQRWSGYFGGEKISFSWVARWLI